MRFEIFDLNGEELRIPIAESYHDCITLIKSDNYRIKGRRLSLLKLILQKNNKVLFWFRLSQYRGAFHPLFSRIYNKVSSRANVQIPWNVKIGYGFFIGHGICIVIHSGTIIGNNVNISQFLNIGSNYNTPAIIGDNVYIGPHVCIVENVTIGKQACIGAGSVVTRSIPQNATAVGVPAKIINYENAGIFIHNRFSESSQLG